MELNIRRRKGDLLSIALICFLSISSHCNFSIANATDLRESSKPNSRAESYDIQVAAAATMTTGAPRGPGRHLTSWGPGSYPPRCTSKCGDCAPCTPVHVPIPPGRPVITEYYPEAWRCKCGNRLYIP